MYKFCVLVGVVFSLICLIYLSFVECELIVCWLIDFFDAKCMFGSAVTKIDFVN